MIVCTDTELFGHLAGHKEIDNRIANIEMMAAPVVEMLGVDGTPALDVESVDFYEKEASFHGRFVAVVEITAYTTSFSGHEYIYGDGLCKVNGSFSIYKFR